MAHRQVIIKRNTGRIALTGTPDDVVALHVIAGAYAAIAHDAGIMVHLNHRRRHVLSSRNRPRREACCGNALLRREIEQQIGFARRTLGMTVVLRRCLWIVGHKEFGQHSAGALHGVTLRLHHHAILGLPNAGRL